MSQVTQKNTHKVIIGGRLVETTVVGCLESNEDGKLTL